MSNSISAVRPNDEQGTVLATKTRTIDEGDEKMKVMILVKASKESEAGEMPSEKLLTEMGKYNQELIDAGIMLAGEGLQPSSKGFRVKFSGSERTVVPGPFSATNELLAGFWIWNVRSVEEAIEWVTRCPNPMTSDSEIEIRQFFEIEDFGDAATPELREQEKKMRSQLEQSNSIPAKKSSLSPRFEQAGPMRIAGLSEHYTMETRDQIPCHWHSFVAVADKIPNWIGDAMYGVTWNADASCAFDYLCGVQIKADASAPMGFKDILIPAHRYAVFTHDKHVSTMPDTIAEIWTTWLPESGLKAAPAPCFERYGKEFDPQTGMGGMEIWVPIQS